MNSSRLFKPVCARSPGDPRDRDGPAELVRGDPSLHHLHQREHDQLGVEVDLLRRQPRRIDGGDLFGIGGALDADTIGLADVLAEDVRRRLLLRNDGHIRRTNRLAAPSSAIGLPWLLTV